MNLNKEKKQRLVKGGIFKRDLEKAGTQFFQILDHCKNCKLCMARMKNITQHAIDEGDYKV